MGLYKGILSPLYGQVLINAVIFGVYGNTLKWIGGSTFEIQFLAGGVAGVVQSFVCSPIELVKIRFQIQGEGGTKTCTKDVRFVYKTPMECLVKIYRHENGLRGVFRGLNLTILREGPSFAVYFSSYEYLCKSTNACSNEVVTLPKLLVNGGIAGVLSWVVTYPFDVIKTRQQMDGMGRNVYSGILHCAICSYKEEGFSVFFQGLTPAMIRAFPVNATTLTTVSVFLNILNR